MAMFFVHFIKRFYELDVFERESLFTIAIVYKKVVFKVCVCLMHKALAVFEFHLGGHYPL